MVRTRALQAAAATDPGRERANNEDRVLCEPELGIFAVIDGVGGESAGEVAAETALEVLRARLSRRTTDADRLVREAIALANRQIYERALANPKLAGMSCVLTVAVLDGARVTVGHVGDSRLYLLLPDGIRKVTADHSPVGAREDAGELSEAEAMRHPRRNEIFRDVGSGPHEPEEASWIDVMEVPFDSDAALLLCSDGLSDLVPSQEIRDTVERHAAAPRAAVRALIDRANAAGGKDNISAVLVVGERYAEASRRRRGGAGAASRTARSRFASPDQDGRADAGRSGATGGLAAGTGVAGTRGSGAGSGGGGGRGDGGRGGGLAGTDSSGTAGGGDFGVDGAGARAGGFAGARSTASGGGVAAAGGGTAGMSRSDATRAAASLSGAAPVRAPRAATAAVGTSASGGGDGTEPRRGPAGAAWAPRGLGERLGDALRGPLVRWLLAAAVLIAALAVFREPLLRAARGFAGGSRGGASGDVLVVGTGDGGFATIGEALAAARPGQTVEVAPGRYFERIALRDGVALVSRVPRGAILLAPPPEQPAVPAPVGGDTAGPASGISGSGAGAGQSAGATGSASTAGRSGGAAASGGPAGPAAAGTTAAPLSADAGATGDTTGDPGLTATAAPDEATAAVVATGVHGARLVGFRVAGDLRAPWTAGIRLEGSEVVVEDVEVSGVAGTGIDVRGADRSTVRYCYVHHNSGPGLAVAGDAAPRLLSNLIAANGIRPGAPAPGVEIRGDAAPLLAENRIEGNGGPGVTLPSPERVDEILRWNAFGAVPRDQAVRVVAGAAGGAGARRPGSGTGGLGSGPTAPGTSAARPTAGAGGGAAPSPAAQRAARRRP
jgi:serine/threonine protein phosphatase PrpC